MSLTLPAFVLGCLVATLLGGAFHLWRGGNLGRILLYLILAWIGFWVGHFVGDEFGLTFGSVGPLRMGAGILAALFLLLVGYWLSLIRENKGT